MYKQNLQLLKDYFSTTENVLIKNKLDLLQLEIEASIIEAKIEVFNELKQINL
jgi:hypothetical protein